MHAYTQLKVKRHWNVIVLRSFWIHFYNIVSLLHGTASLSGLVSRVQSPYYIILTLHKSAFLDLASGSPLNYGKDTNYSSPQGPASTTGKQEESFRLTAVFFQHTS